jgi:tetratricopeptide (TPR) repeat protein
MTLMLYEQMRDLSPIVVGYSGWEGDIIMSAVRRRLESGRLANPIFWFCFRRGSMDDLPDWLTSDPDVLFVLPDDATAKAKSGPEPQPVQQGFSSLPIPGEAIESGKPLDEEKESTLTAVQVFDALITGFGLSTPDLTKDPLNFYARQLRSQLGTKSQEESEKDTFYSFHAVIERVERAAKAEKDATPDELQASRDAMGKADYLGAIRAAGQVQLNLLPAAKLSELLLVLRDAISHLDDECEEEIGGLDLISEAGTALAKLDPAGLSVLEVIAKALYEKGATLAELNRNEGALAAYDNLLRRFGDAQAPGIQGFVARALVNKGVRFSKLNRSEEALAAYDDALRRFADSQDPRFREPVAKALHNKGYELGKLGKAEEGIAAYDEVARRFADAQEPLIREMVARALVGKGSLLWNLKKMEETLVVHDDLVGRFADASEPEIRKLVKMALIRRAIVIAQLKGGEEGVAACGDVVDRFAEDQEPGIRELVAYALYNKAYLLWGLTRCEEAIATWDEVVRRFADAQEPGVRAWVAKALHAKGSTFASLELRDEAMKAYAEVVRLFANSPEKEIEEVVERASSRLRELSGDDPKPTETSSGATLPPPSSPQSAPPVAESLADPRSFPEIAPASGDASAPSEG